MDRQQFKSTYEGINPIQYAALLFVLHVFKVYLLVLKGYVPQEMMLTFSSFLDFCYIVYWNVIDMESLEQLEIVLPSISTNLQGL